MEHRRYQSSRIRANWTRVLLIVFGVISLVSIFFTITEIGLLEQIESGAIVSEAEVTNNDDRQAAIGALYIVAFVATVIAFCMWIHRASTNLPPLGVHDQRFSPRWAVGWWFVPIMWLFRPYQVMKEVWKGSYPIQGLVAQAAWRDAPASPLLGWWWAAWLLSAWVGDVGVQIFLRGQTTDELITGDWLVVVSEVIGILAIVLVFVLVQQITSNQEEKYTAREAEEESKTGPTGILARLIIGGVVVLVVLGVIGSFIDDESEPPPSTPTSMENLRELALELINADRAKHGVQPVSLGTNQAAQLHADDAIKSGYLVGHWTSDGLKPYMLYRQAGGVGVIAENAAGGGYSPTECEQPLVVCGRIDAEEMITDLQYSMMYDDADSDWGHRDTIIDPNYDTVNIGIVLDKYQLAFYQHFEYNGLTYESEPTLDGSVLTLQGRPIHSHVIGGLAVYYDAPPTPKRPEEISRLRAYCAGGGFTDDCDSVRPIAIVLKPPTDGKYYIDLDPEDFVASLWKVHADGSVQIEADIGALTSRPGVYTIVVLADSEDPRPLSTYSLFR